MKRWVSISLAISVAISTMFVAGASSKVSAAPGDVITFDDFAVGTVITNQYQSFGVRFGGSVFITNDSAQPTTPVLSGTPLFEGPVSGSFVNPANGLLVTQYGFTVDVGYINNPGSVKITAFDFSAEEITHTFANAEGINHIDVTAAGVSYFRIETVSDEAAGFSIDNFRVKTAPEGVIVKSMASLGDSYSAGEGLLPEKGLRYDCGTDLPIGVYFENTTVSIHDSWSNGTSCDTVTKSTTAPAGYKNRPHDAYSEPVSPSRCRLSESHSRAARCRGREQPLRRMLRCCDGQCRRGGGDRAELRSIASGSRRRTAADDEPVRVDCSARQRPG